MAKFFDADPLAVCKEILQLEAKEFGDHVYFYNSETWG